jgi:hypothetical protein
VFTACPTVTATVLVFNMFSEARILCSQPNNNVWINYPCLGDMVFHSYFCKLDLTFNVLSFVNFRKNKNKIPEQSQNPIGQ